MQILSTLLTFTAAVSLASAAVAGPAAAGVAVTEFLEARDLELASLPLEKRACENTGCKCRKNGNNLQQAQYCGNCKWTSTNEYIISAKRNSNHIYECSPSGSCCDYGPSNCASKPNQCPK